jgi:hypothetical protein
VAQEPEERDRVIRGGLKDWVKEKVGMGEGCGSAGGASEIRERMIYYVDEVCGWLFWRADLGDGVWVADVERATHYPTRMRADNAAEEVADRESDVEVRVIGRHEMC